MNSKSLAMTNGIVGLVGGIILLFGGWLVVGSAATGDTNTFGTTVAIFYILKLAILVLGIIGAVHFRGSDVVTAAPDVLLIVGGALSLVPMLGWVGGILAIIGGSLFLGTLKKFKGEMKEVK